MFNQKITFISNFLHYNFFFLNVEYFAKSFVLTSSESTIVDRKIGTKFGLKTMNEPNNIHVLMYSFVILFFAKTIYLLIKS